MRGAALALVFLQACSLVFVTGPADGPQLTEPDCTRRPLVPVIDNYLSLAAWAAGLILAVRNAVPSTRGSHVGEELAIAGAAILVGVGFRLSSDVGFRRVGRCNHAVRRYEQRLEDESFTSPGQ
jgi:hypothetical protein